MFRHLSFVLSFRPVFVDFFCVSSRISHPGFDFSSCFLTRSQFFQKLILQLHRLVHLIWLYYSLIYKVVHDLFFVSVLTVLHSVFLSEGKVDFSPFIILFKFSRFTFRSWISVCSGLFSCAFFGWVVFLFSEVGGSFRLGCFCLLILGVF